MFASLKLLVKSLLLTAPLANHDFVMSGEERKKRRGNEMEIGERKDKMGRGDKEYGTNGEVRRYVGEASATVSVLYVPTSSSSVKGD